MNKLSRRRVLVVTAIDMAIGVVFVGLMLLFSQDFTLIGFIDATMVAAVLLFAVGWFFFVANNHVFDIITYGVKSFFKGVIGKREKTTYIEYLETKKTVEPFMYHAFWYASLVILAVSLILYAVYKF
ncbi:MAG: DUF3899 domain-containing protein [Candidatus Izemoplasmatales bacterium]